VNLEVRPCGRVNACNDGPPVFRLFFQVAKAATDEVWERGFPAIFLLFQERARIPVGDGRATWRLKKDC
jgi:hypothetical protein